jgi:hypothetical protein
VSPRFGCLAYLKAEAVDDVALDEDLALGDGDEFQKQGLAGRAIGCVEDLAGELAEVRGGRIAVELSHATLQASIFRGIE